MGVALFQETPIFHDISQRFLRASVGFNDLQCMDKMMTLIFFVPFKKMYDGSHFRQFSVCRSWVSFATAEVIPNLSISLSL